MPLLRRFDGVLHFVHIPKTGGTSIESYLSSKGAVALLSNGAMGFSRTPLQHMHRALFEVYLPGSFVDHEFAVIRHPVDRLRSVFQSRARWQAGVAGVADPPDLLRFEREIMPIPSAPPYYRPEGEALAFDEWLPEALTRLATDPYLYENHMRPQVDYLRSTTRIFLFEAGLEPVYDWIDSITDGQPGDRGSRLNTSEADWSGMSRSTRTEIESFYRDDLEAWNEVRSSTTDVNGVGP